MNSKKSNRAARERAGRRAETMAAMFLRLKGYRILERRYRAPQGEIDIIASKSGTLAIVEVKQRATADLAEDSLTPGLIRRVTGAAETYYARHKKVQNLGIRFDAIFIIGRWKIIHKPDAWRDY